jgi:predicted AAA+ superfamily ATPase
MLSIRMLEVRSVRWFDDYASSSMQRDVAAITSLRRGTELPTLFARLAGQTGQVLNITAAARASALKVSTASTYVTLLENLFLIHRLPAWGRTLRARATALPKLHLVDSGLAARLLRITPQRLGRLDPATLTEFGHLLETFVVGELLKQASWTDDVTAVGHWRTHDGHEVDLVVEHDDGAITGFEVKAGRDIRHHDARGLLTLRDTLGDQFNAGFILTTGDTSYRLDERIYVTPIDQLWKPNTASPR